MKVVGHIPKLMAEGITKFLKRLRERRVLDMAWKGLKSSLEEAFERIDIANFAS